MKPHLQLDHFVIAIANLEKGIADFEARTGVRPVFGGEHEKLGTHNALVSLGAGQYLEILAPRPGARTGDFVPGIDAYEHLTPVLWSVASPDVTSTRTLVEGAGCATRPLLPGSRVTPDGTSLRWTMLFLDEPDLVTVPFFIEWHVGSVHPSENTPSGCTLSSFTITEPNADRLRRLLSALDLAVPVAAGAPAGLTITLDSPKGRVVLDGGSTSS